MPPARMTPAQLREHFAGCDPVTRATARALRRSVLALVPDASETLAFGALAYVIPGAAFGSIGGNICMIEVRDGGVTLSFIHGAELPDPSAVLRGSAKSKRFVPITTAAQCRSAEIADLVRAAAARARNVPRRRR